MLVDFDLQNIAGLSEAEAAQRLEAAWLQRASLFQGPQHLCDRLGSGTRADVPPAGCLRHDLLALGDVQEALMLLGFVFVVLGITLYQERKTERALEALRDLSSPRALVIRGGRAEANCRPGGRPDDILVLAEGDRVPADAVVLSCNNFSTDESLLTGESVPVQKGRLGRGRGDESSGRRRPSLRLFRDADRPGPGDRPSAVHRHPHRNGQDRQGSAHAGAGRNPAEKRSRTARAASGDHRIVAVRSRGRYLRPYPWQLAPRVPGRDHPGDGDVARRSSPSF